MKELTIEERVDFYSAPHGTIEKHKNLENKEYAELHSKPNHYQYSIIKTESNENEYINHVLWGESSKRFDKTKLNQIKYIYINPLINFLDKKNIKSKNIPLLWGDVFWPGTVLAFSKTRSIDHAGPLSLLKCLNEKRHWDLSFEDLTPFRKKKEILKWRGANTGGNSNRWQRRELRLDLVKKWFNKSNIIDVGFSSIPQKKDRSADYSVYLKKTETRSQLLSNKYILSVEGNDKDSGLNWKLCSNSLVFMPKPKVSSWLMEENLIPNFHYLEVKPDFSDLEDLVHWSNDNPHKCEEIIHNANQHMKQFEDKEREDEIQKQVIEKTLSYIT